MSKPSTSPHSVAARHHVSLWNRRAACMTASLAIALLALAACNGNGSGSGHVGGGPNVPPPSWAGPGNSIGGSTGGGHK
ncbi:MAG TPA: hypothetical protein VG797_01175 [Phycisphaerales bacterium]|nr:hypothetical protein [Phycisphaerales bacterium]